MVRDVSRAAIVRGVLSVSWPFLSIIAVLVQLAFVSMSTLSAARAFVGGESLWSKGQKEAVQQLQLYARSGSQAHYARFEAAIAVPLGDHMARLSLERAHPDLAVATAGLLQGGNDARDIPGMMRLFLRFHRFGPIARAVDAWRQGDVQIDALVAVGQAIRRAMGQGDRAGADRALAQLLAIDARLTPLETTFSAALGDASRLAERLLQVSTGVLAVLLAGAGLARTRQVVLSEQRMAAALRFNEQRQKAALAASDHGIFDLDLVRGTAHLSANFMAALGYPDWPDQVALAGISELIHPADRPLYASRVQQDDGPGNDLGRYVEYRLLCASGEVRWVRVEAGAMRDPSGRRVRLAGTLRDITEQRLAKDQLFEQTERALVTLDSISDAVITTDGHGRVDYMNPSAEALLGLRLGEVRGQDVETLGGFVDEADGHALQHPVVVALASGEAAATPPTAALATRGGGLSVDASAAPMHGRDRRVFGAVLVLRDVRQDRIAASQMRHQATHDVLTGLVNRREFESRVDAAVRARAGDGPAWAICYVDLDRFKIVNDTCGHEAGDRLLCQLSELMASALRETDTLARLGGDEFAVLLQGPSAAYAGVVADKIRDVVASYRFHDQGRIFSVSASIGVIQGDDGLDAYADAMRAADAACYQAKRQGGDQVHLAPPWRGAAALDQAAADQVAVDQVAVDQVAFDQATVDQATASAAGDGISSASCGR